MGAIRCPGCDRLIADTSRSCFNCQERVTGEKFLGYYDRIVRAVSRGTAEARQEIVNQFSEIISQEEYNDPAARIQCVQDLLPSELSVYNRYFPANERYWDRLNCAESPGSLEVL